MSDPLRQRAARALHTWAGLACALVLFVVFCAGALTVFGKELDRWGAGETRPAAQADPAALEAAAAEIQRRHPELKGAFSLAVPGELGPDPVAYWQDPATGDWVFGSAGDLASGRPAAARGGLGTFFNELHHEFGLGRAGALLLGGVCLLYALALLTGAILHLPRGRRALSVAWKAPARRTWGDAHGALGLAALPLHGIFAVTGALFSLFLVLVATYDATVYRGQLAPRLDAILGTAAPAASGRPGSPLPLARLLEAASAAAPGFEPRFLRFVHAGDAAATLQILGHRPGGVAPFGQLAVAMDTGTVTDVQVPGRRDGNHALLSTLYGLHFGDFGGRTVQAAWFTFGVAGALAFLAGMGVAVEARWKRRPSQARLMARLTVGVCGGALAGLAACFPAARLGAASLGWVFWPCLLGGVLWAGLGPLRRSLRGLAWATAAGALAIPLLSLSTHPVLAVLGAAAGALFLVLGARLPRHARNAWA